MHSCIRFIHLLVGEPIQDGVQCNNLFASANLFIYYYPTKTTLYLPDMGFQLSGELEQKHILAKQKLRHHPVANGFSSIIYIYI